jgi:small conductance mechanosensitive channel
MIRRLLLVLLIMLAVIIGPLALAFGILRVAGIDVVPLLQSTAGTTGLMRLLVEYYDLIRLPLHLFFIAAVFFLAWGVSRISGQLAGWLLRAAGYQPHAPRPGSDEALVADRRRQTAQQIVGGFITLIAFTLAILLSISQFFSLSNLAIIATVGANAFGFAARDYVGDLLNGVSNIFENRFNVGDKVEVFRVGNKVEGQVENVTVRTLSLRTREGELINVPQGEVRILRNYSRGSYSGVDVICRVQANDLPAAMAELHRLGQDAPALLPDLIEPWMLMSRDGELGRAAEIRIHAKARFGYGAGLRLQIMMLVEGQLSAAAIPLA